MRQLQFTNEKGERHIIPHTEAVKIVERIVTTGMVRDCFVSGIAIKADGGYYRLLEEGDAISEKANIRSVYKEVVRPGAVTPMPDGIELKTIKHSFYPGAKWYMKVWYYIRSVFRGHPRFSQEALESADKWPGTVHAKIRIVLDKMSGVLITKKRHEVMVHGIGFCKTCGELKKRCECPGGFVENTPCDPKTCKYL